ncbi:MAG: hypothetical protein ACXVXM_13965 [Nocardioidaceae bacterium]
MDHQRSTRSPKTVRLALVAAAVLALAMIGATNGASASPKAGTQKARSTNGAAAVSRRTAHLVGVSSPATAPAAKARAHFQQGLPVLRPHRGQAARTHAPSVHGSRVAKRPARLLKSFDGVDAVQQKAVTGFDTEPPDEGLGASSTRLVQFINVVGAVFRHDGSAVGKPFYLNDFFKEPADAFTSDPRIFYDASSRRWFGTMVEVTFSADGTQFTESHVDLAVSRTADPRGTWKIYQIPTSNLSHPGCPCLADYPILGVDRKNVYISTNEFQSDVAAGVFNGAQLYAISKPQLVAGAAKPNLVAFENLSAGGSLAFHVQPANTFSAAPAEFALSSIDPDGTTGNQLAVWAVTKESAVTTGKGTPRLRVRVIDSEAYAFPPNAQTPPGTCTGDLCPPGGAATTGVVATDFDAMEEVQLINGVLVGALNTGLTPSGDTDTRSGVAWFVVAPHVRGAALTGATRVVRQGYVAVKGEYLLYPHVNMTGDGAMALVFGLGGPDTFLSSAYAVAAPHHRFGTVTVAAAGTGPDNGVTGTADQGGVGRWGDYSNGEIVPGTGQVWLATQYIPNQGDGNANWGNNIFGLRLP